MLLKVEQQAADGQGEAAPRQFLPTETVKFIAPPRDQTTTRVILHDHCKPSGLEVYLRIEYKLYRSRKLMYLCRKSA